LVGISFNQKQIFISIKKNKNYSSEKLENKNRELIKEKGLEAGLAFPTGKYLSTFVLDFSISFVFVLPRLLIE